MKKDRKYDLGLMVKGKKTDFINMQIRRITMPLTRFIAKHTDITPNQISVSNLFLMILAVLALGISGYTNHAYEIRLIGSIIVFLTTILDHVDGKLARVKRITSLFGKWLDDVPALIFVPFTLFSLALGLNNPRLMPIGALAMLCFPMQFLLIYYFKAEFQSKAKGNIDVVKKDNKLRYVYGTVYLYVLLPLACIFNQPHLILWFFAIFGNLFWIVVMFLQLFALIKQKKQSDFK